MQNYTPTACLATVQGIGSGLLGAGFSLVVFKLLEEERTILKFYKEHSLLVIGVFLVLLVLFCCCWVCLFVFFKQWYYNQLSKDSVKGVKSQVQTEAQSLHGISILVAVSILIQMLSVKWDFEKAVKMSWYVVWYCSGNIVKWGSGGLTSAVINLCHRINKSCNYGSDILGNSVRSYCCNLSAHGLWFLFLFEFRDFKLLENVLVIVQGFIPGKVRRLPRKIVEPPSLVFRTLWYWFVVSPCCLTCCWFIFCCEFVSFSGHAIEVLCTFLQRWFNRGILGKRQGT